MKKDGDSLRFCVFFQLDDDVIGLKGKLILEGIRESLTSKLKNVLLFVADGSTK
jgi:hypothetical protein